MQSPHNDCGSATRNSGQFASTHWSTVLAAGGGDSRESREALERLCRTYWYPLYAFVRRRGFSPADAADQTQAFFARFLEKHYLKDVVRGRGRFRSFLLASLTHFLCNEWDRVHRAKRCGQLKWLPLDLAEVEERYELDLVSDETAERHYDRLWAEAVMERALEALEGECRAAGKEAQFGVLAEFLTQRPEEGEYAAAGERLGLNRHAVAVAVARLRERYAALVRAEIAHTMGQQTNIEAEVRYLIELVSQ